MFSKFCASGRFLFCDTSALENLYKIVIKACRGTITGIAKDFLLFEVLLQIQVTICNRNNIKAM